MQEALCTDTRAKIDLKQEATSYDWLKKCVVPILVKYR